MWRDLWLIRSVNRGGSGSINKLASIWADALISRDGHPRYEMISAAMKEQFKQEQAARSGENWNYNIGVSSPWAADYEIRIKGKTQESLTFAVEDGDS